MDFILASQSPARLKTLKDAGINAQVKVSTVDEDAVSRLFPNSTPEELVTELAKAKALNVADTLNTALSQTPSLVVGADSMLEIDAHLQGKPHEPQIALERWQKMRGKTGILHTGHAIFINKAAVGLASNTLQSSAVHPYLPTHIGLEERQSGIILFAHAQTKILFANLSDSEIQAYVDTAEPLQVAGAFTIDGLGGAFVEGIEGDPHSVVGISLPLLRLMTNRAGIAWHSLWESARNC
ncbi:Maf family protein [Actinomycetaceae bacterium TAE3-ERU4]|nr:Maf family protein [Actinomycetaceae bacterium TAE3-ERU4]